MQFIDEVKIYVRGGDGGDGCVAFRREKYVPRGGPSGGDGGNGGSVILVADPQLSTLLDLRYQQRYSADRGEHGQGRDRYGKAAPDMIVRVPAGTLVRDADTGEQLADLARPEARFVAAQGGKGGRGNIHFATSTNQTPRNAEEGTPGQERTLKLVLKLIADAGLLGYPNVGKSTFISRVSRARPKIADYPFTTLVPNLGVVQLSDGRSFVLADIPGLIEGASEGHGLGHRFLRHVERTRVLVHLLDATPTAWSDAETGAVPDDADAPPAPTATPDGAVTPLATTSATERNPLHDFDAINRELERYDPALARRPQIVALSKMDLPATREAYPALREAFRARGIDLLAVSAATGEGLPEVLERLWAELGR